MDQIPELPQLVVQRGILGLRRSGLLDGIETNGDFSSAIDIFRESWTPLDPVAIPAGIPVAYL